MKQRGVALVLVLWVLSLLTIMAGSFTLSMRREGAIASGLKANAQALAIAESGISLAETFLLSPDAAKRWRTDGSIYQIDMLDAQLRVRLITESGKININSASENLLRSVLANAPVGTAQRNVDLAAAIVDWRDNDDEQRPQGAEKKLYKAAGLSYQPRNKAFQSLDELQLVLGMNEAVFNWLVPFITVYSAQPKVSLDLATAEVLMLLPDVNPAVIAPYVQLRIEAARRGLPAPPFNNDLKKLSLSTEAVQATADTPPDTETVNDEIVSDVNLGEVTTIVAEVVFVDGTSAAIVAMVEHTEDGQSTTPYQVLQWQRNPRQSLSLFADSMDDLVVRHYAEPELND